MSFLKRCYPAAYLCTCLMVGCSDPGEGGDRVETHEVSGKVTMAGGPVAGASVIFSPKEGQPVATGRTNNEGEYTLMTYESGDGAATGEYEVLISKSVASQAPPAYSHDPGTTATYQPPAHSGPGRSGGSAGAASSLPERYSRAGQSGLTVKVPAESEDAYNFDLKP